MTVFLVCLALAGFALLYSLWVPEQEVVLTAPPTALDHLLEKKKVIYDNLKDLNFEYRTGKLSDDDYKQLKTGLQYELALLMQQIEEAQQQIAPGTGGSAREAPAVAAREKATPASVAVAAVAEDEGLLCPGCGHRNAPSHKHCSECGAWLAAVLAAFVFFAALAAPCAFAQGARVGGTVVNLTNGKPAAGVEISLMRAGQTMDVLAQAKTDASGRFSFPNVQRPAPPEMLLARAEYQGVRYTEVVGDGPVEMKVFNAGAPRSAIHIGDRAVILQPRGGKLLVNELYLISNESSPPQAYRGPFRFWVPVGAEDGLQAGVMGAGGMSVPVEPKREAVAAKPDQQGAVFRLEYPMKPGENRVEVTYQLDYAGSLMFESQAIEKVERTRIALGQGAQVEGEGLAFLATEPQMKFAIYSVANNERWTVNLSGESQAPPDAAGGQGSGDNTVVTLPGRVAELRFAFLATFLVLLAAGFYVLWRQAKPAARD